MFDASKTCKTEFNDVSVGKVPINALFEISMYARHGSWKSIDGIFPVKSLLVALKNSNDVIVDMPTGNDPENRALDSCKSCKNAKFPMVDGIEPVMSVLVNANSFKADMSPISGCKVPVICVLLSCRTYNHDMR